jgi:phospholipid/cholesterol/gamma-HCH transport system permease protein
MTERMKRISAPDIVDRKTGQELYEQAYRQKVERGDTLVVDFGKTREIDSQGGAWVVAMAHYAGGRGGSFKTENQHNKVAEFINMIEPGFGAEPPKRTEEEGFFESTGGRTLKHLGEVREFLGLLVDTIYWTILAPFEGRGFRWGLWSDEVYEMGVRAVRINVLMNFLLGLIIAMLSAAQIAKFGLGIYVADLLTIAFARELAAIMTAIVVSARTGAAIAAELSTMKVQEEIDALRSMGLNVNQFLVAPKVLALLVVMPCLVALGMIAGVLGGSLWGILVLNIRPDTWFHETLNAASMSDITQGMLKAVTFAIMIVLVGCHNGFRVKGGSRGVGLMTTRAVVMDIFFIIVIDIIFAAIFYYVLEIDQFA